MDVIGNVVSINGEVEAEFDQGSRPLETGAPIYEGDTIITGAGASVEIQLADDSILAQGENASQSIDSYIYDPDDANASSLLVNMSTGAFRMVTGQIGKDNPEGVKVETPLATIGIRGTGMDMLVSEEDVKVGCFQYDGLDISISTPQGQRFLTNVNSLLTIKPNGIFGEIRSYSDSEIKFFKSAAPITSMPDADFYGDDDDYDDGVDGQQEQGDVQGQQQDQTLEGGGEWVSEGTDEFGDKEQPEVNQTMNQVVLSTKITLLNFTMHVPLILPLNEPDENDDDDLTDEAELPKLASRGIFPDTLLPFTGNEDGSEVDVDTGLVTIVDGDGNQNELESSDSFFLLRGYDDNDKLYGSTHSSTLYGGADSFDTLYGGAGNDSCIGGDNADLIIGGTGDDTIDGFAGNDSLYGGNGNDMLTGQQGADLLSGGADSDILIGGAGADTIYGGHGDDYFLFSGNSELDAHIMDFQEDNDTIIVDRSILDWDVGTVAEEDTNLFFIDEEYALGGFVSVPSDAGPALVFDSADNLYSVMDSAAGPNGADLIAHIDYTTPEASNIKVADITVLNDTNNTFSGSAAHDFVILDGGNDFYTASEGMDTVIGCAGEDTFHFDANTHPYLTIGDFETGTDSLKLDLDSNSSTTFNVQISGGGIASSAFHHVTGSYSGIDETETWQSNNPGHLILDGDNILWYDADINNSGKTQIAVLADGTLEYSDFIVHETGGVSGDDNGTTFDSSAIYSSLIYTGDSAENTYVGNDGLGDLMKGKAGDDNLTGRDGHDTLFGGANNDSLYGGGHHDLLIGGTGNDLLVGGSSADTLYGGTGSDTFHYAELGSGTDAIKDFSSATDYLSFDYDSSNADETFKLSKNMASSFLESQYFHDVTGTYSGEDSTNSWTNDGYGHIILDDNGDLWYDADITSTGNEDHIANINETITCSNIVVNEV